MVSSPKAASSSSKRTETTSASSKEPETKKSRKQLKDDKVTALQEKAQKLIDEAEEIKASGDDFFEEKIIKMEKLMRNMLEKMTYQEPYY